jgi:hypothetical protein
MPIPYAHSGDAESSELQPGSSGVKVDTLVYTSIAL